MPGPKGEVPGQAEPTFDLTKPLSPEEMLRKKHHDIPGVVIECFNEVIQKHLLNETKRSAFGQEEVIALLVDKGTRKGDIFDRNWLDVEPLYREKGWDVKYEKHDEGGGSFTFSIPKKEDKS